MAPGQDDSTSSSSSSGSGSASSEAAGAPADGGWSLPDLQDIPDALGDLGPTAVELTTTYGVRILGAMIILVLAWFAGLWARRGTRALLKRTHVDGTVRSFLSTTVRWVVFVLGVILCLGAFGVETTSVAALLGGAGVGIGVALQGNLANLASGLLLVAFRPFTEGDWITLESSDVDGRISSVGLLFTELDTFTNQRVVLPNNLLFDQPITNHEHHAIRRADVDVGVAYETDLARADEILRDMVHRIQDEIGPPTEREPVVWWLGYGSSSINLKVGVWCRRGELFETHNKVILEIHRTFAEHEITIPFPQRDLHLKEPQASELTDALAAK